MIVARPCSRRSPRVDNVLDGFIPRFIFVSGSATPRPVAKLTAAMKAEFAAVVGYAQEFYEKCQALSDVGIGEEVLSLLFELEQKWDREAREPSSPRGSAPALKRLAEAVLKVAALIAIDESDAGQIPMVTAYHWGVALEMVERWKENTLEVIHALGATAFTMKTDNVFAEIKRHQQGIPVRDLMRDNRDLKRRDMDEILETLEVREQIEVVDVPSKGGRGRKPQVAFPYGHAPVSEETHE